MPRAVIHICVPVTNFREPVDLLRLHSKFQTSMVSQICLGSMGTNDKNYLGPRVKPLCEALAISHIMKIEGTQERMELLKKGKADKSGLNFLKGQVLVISKS